MPDGFFPSESTRPVPPPREMKPLSDDPETRRWERYQEFFAQREQQSHTAIKVLRVMEEMTINANQLLTPKRVEEFQTEVEARVGSGLKQASPEMQTAFKHAAWNWAVYSVKAERVMREMIPDAPRTPEAWDYAAGAIAGYEIFREHVGEEPRGSVRFTRKGPFFYFSFLDTRDYLAFKAEFTDEGERFEGGIFLPLAQWPPNTIVPTILQKGDEVDASILAHEGQHFLNHSLGMVLENWEPGAQNKDSPESTDRPQAQMHRRLKDELIAYIRGGTDPEVIQKTLERGAHYDGLYRIPGVSEQEAQRAEDMLKNVCQALSQHIWMKQKYSRHQTHLCELMVATLLDIPLRKMEGYIRLSSKYYEERVEAVSVSPSRLEFPIGAEGERAWYDAAMAHRQKHDLALGFMSEYLDEERLRPTDPKTLERGTTVPRVSGDIKKKRSSAISNAAYRADQAWLDKADQRRRIDRE